MRNEVVAGIAGLVVGHILWLAAITLATDSSRVNIWVLVVAALSFLGAVLCWYLGRQKRRQKDYVWSVFLWALPVSPVVFSLAVLGVTYL